jgi:hypothetical protein
MQQQTTVKATKMLYDGENDANQTPKKDFGISQAFPIWSKANLQKKKSEQCLTALTSFLFC